MLLTLIYLRMFLRFIMLLFLFCFLFTHNLKLINCAEGGSANYTHCSFFPAISRLIQMKDTKGTVSFVLNAINDRAKYVNTLTREHFRTLLYWFNFIASSGARLQSNLLASLLRFLPLFSKSRLLKVTVPLLRTHIRSSSLRVPSLFLYAGLTAPS